MFSSRPRGNRISGEREAVDFSVRARCPGCVSVGIAVFRWRRGSHHSIKVICAARASVIAWARIREGRGKTD